VGAEVRFTLPEAMGRIGLSMSESPGPNLLPKGRAHSPVLRAGTCCLVLLQTGGP
jgi:hypothetical protein